MRSALADASYEDVRREKLKRRLERNPKLWLSVLFPLYTSQDFASHHEEFWDWAWSIEPDGKSPSFFAIWPRGHAKSTSGELACVALGARQKKRYVLYVCGTQEQADDHVSNIAEMLESTMFGEVYPELTRPKVGKYGNSRGWRRNRLRTASGFTVDAIGLDTAARGAKVEEDRPDLIVLDDIDSEADSEKVTDRKLKAITRKLLPAGADKLTVMVLQNLVHENSIVSRLVSGQVRFLGNRIVSGPIVALEDLRTEDEDGRDVIREGVPTWDGMDRERCQEMIDEMGLDAFLVECQHLTEVLSLWPYKREYFRPGRFDNSLESHSQACIGRYISLDTALKDNTDSDYSAWIVAELTPDYRLQIREAHTERLEFPELFEEMVSLASRCDQDFKLRRIIIEDKVSGTSLYQSLVRWAPHLEQYLDVFLPTTDKDHRNRLAAPWAKRGCISLPHPGPDARWLPALEEQLFNASSKKKDLRDAFNQLVIYEELMLAEGWAARGQAVA